MRRTKLSVLLPLAALALFLTLGCGDESKKSEKPEEKDKGKRAAKADGKIDYTDADAVAKAFVKALADKDLAASLALIHPENRDELKRDLGKEFPPVPDDPQVTVKVTEAGGVKTGKFQGNVRSIRNLGMKFDQGKWWVVD